MAKGQKSFSDYGNRCIIPSISRSVTAFIVFLISLLGLSLGTFTSWEMGILRTNIGSTWSSAFICRAQTPLGSRELSYGSRGDDVLELQYRLNLLGFYIKVLDGIYGNETLRAVLEFQAAANLSRTGKVDASTAQAILSGKVKKGTGLQEVSQNYRTEKPPAPKQAPGPSESKTPTSKTTPREKQVTKNQAAGPKTLSSAPAAKRQDIAHVVKKGECLSILGERYNVSVKEIMKLNGLQNTIIYIGQRLTIPAGSGVAKGKDAHKNIEYLVKDGDCLSTIAASFKITISNIIRANNIKDPDFIRAGQTLTIPLS